MSGEQNMRQVVGRALKKDLQDPVSVENRVYPGTPDTNYKGGWIELKRNLSFPKDPEGIVKPDSKFTQEQRVWLIKRCRVGGRAHLLWQIGREWFLFDGTTAAECVGRATQAVLRDNALVIWQTNSDMREGLTQWLYA